MCIQHFLLAGEHTTRFLCKELNIILNQKYYIPDKKTIEFKEAIIFGLLGVLKIK